MVPDDRKSAGRRIQGLKVVNSSEFEAANELAELWIVDLGIDLNMPYGLAAREGKWYQRMT